MKASHIDLREIIINLTNQIFSRLETVFECIENKPKLLSNSDNTKFKSNEELITEMVEDFSAFD